ncbi:hypothetical protein AB2L28_20585 [Kineococcus sp. TBRC 1896]|uniref:Transmembrane protein n=1 Tax=Kineococcus mangrovi TaxID=1660183 RepID=A0ABV4I7I9_9ACTN
MLIYGSARESASHMPLVTRAQVREAACRREQEDVVTWLDVAAISGLIVAWQVVLTLMLRRALRRMERRLTHQMERVGS